MKKLNNSVMIYEYEKYGEKTVNIGDYIQSIAALKIIDEDWRDLNYINREELYINQEENTKLIANGWYAHNPGFFL